MKDEWSMCKLQRDSSHEPPYKLEESRKCGWPLLKVIGRSFVIYSCTDEKCFIFRVSDVLEHPLHNVAALSKTDFDWDMT